MAEESFRAEDEINLADYLRILLKRKWLIFGCFLFFAVVAGILSYTTPKVYKIDTVLEIGRVEEMIEDPIQLVGKIGGGVYGIKIREILQIPEAEWPEVKAENPEGTDLVIKTIEASDTEKAKQVLEEGNSLILADHQEKIEIQKSLVEIKIKTAEDKIKLVEIDIQKTRNKIEPIDSNIERIENKIVFAGEEEESLAEKVSVLQQQLVYEQTPGTQFALFDAKEKLASKKQEIEDLYLSINSLRVDKEDLEVAINSLMVDIGNLNDQIGSLEATLGEIRSTEILKSPSVSENPINQDEKVSIAIGGILGLFLGVFLALGKEWWEKEGRRGDA